MKNYDVIAVGLGPAACSAALYTAMGGYKTLLVGQAAGSLYKAEKIVNFYGQEVISGKELFEKGISRAKEVGAEVEYAQVVEIAYEEGGFKVKSDKSEYFAKAVLLATGAARGKPKLGGLSEFDGKGVSWCAVCDGFFYRKKKGRRLRRGAIRARRSEIPFGHRLRCNGFYRRQRNGRAVGKDGKAEDQNALRRRSSGRRGTRRRRTNPAFRDVYCGRSRFLERFCKDDRS